MNLSQLSCMYRQVGAVATHSLGVTEHANLRGIANGPLLEKSICSFVEVID